MPENILIVTFRMAARRRHDGRWEGLLQVEGSPEIYVTQSRQDVARVERDLKRQATEILGEKLNLLPIAD